MIKKQKTTPLSDLVLIGALTVLLVLKSALLYSGMYLAEFEPPLAVATGAFFLLFYTVIALFSPRGAKVASLILYALFSLLMGVDGVYYSYVSKLPSVVNLGLVGQLDDIAETIKSLIKVHHLAMLADLPLLFLGIVNRDVIRIKYDRFREKRKIASSTEKALSRPIASAICLVLCLAMGLFTFTFPEFEPQYIENELFYYHVSDVASLLFPKNDERVVDKAAYTEVDYSSSDYWGLAKDRNVFIIQVEALQNFVLNRTYEGQTITPNLNALLSEDSFYFDRYYYQIGGGNTADAEFAVNNSLFAPEEEAAYIKYAENTYHGLPYLLKDQGYSGAHAYHAYIPSFWNREAAYPHQGFDSFTSLDDFDETDMFEMGLSDVEMFRQSMETLKTYEEPFYAFYVTLSSHFPYGIPLKDRQIALKPADEQTLFGLYLQSVEYADRSIGAFMDMLKEAGLYENSVFVIYGDHYALHNTDQSNMDRVSALLGRQYSIYDVFNVPLIIHVPGMDRAKTVSVAGGHMDVLPTLLPLLGIHNDKTVMFGQNLLEAEKGLVCQQTHMSVGSFISDQVFYKKPHNNIKSNYDAYAYGTMERLDPMDFLDISRTCAQRIADCAALMKNNDLLLD